ncbi:hypothetical protein BV25DRAFT_1916052 [Artomyces pyxidatus]|uniref:Uncharacterized protein n=1 Tax=Artomyces pyxidatus TaxID=48021 RepID=A0ACB8T2S8_9AGAM|nr:hypothetical protein BV25DRAFT_1916052 [Artomyces pyxidatus]
MSPSPAAGNGLTSTPSSPSSASDHLPYTLQKLSIRRPARPKIYTPTLLPPAPARRSATTAPTSHPPEPPHRDTLIFGWRPPAGTAALAVATVSLPPSAVHMRRQLQAMRLTRPYRFHLSAPATPLVPFEPLNLVGPPIPRKPEDNAVNFAPGYDVLSVEEALRAQKEEAYSTHPEESFDVSKLKRERPPSCDPGADETKKRRLSR